MFDKPLTAISNGLQGLLRLSINLYANNARDITINSDIVSHTLLSSFILLWVKMRDESISIFLLQICCDEKFKKKNLFWKRAILPSTLIEVFFELF